MNDAKPVVKWILLILSMLAFGLGLWLTIQKWTGQINSLAGCGSGSGCANVLGSKWSMVLGIVPVSVFSCLLYLAMVASLWMRGTLVDWARSLMAWMLLLAAMWFIAVQLFVIRAICPYCMIIHGVGITIGLIVLLCMPPLRKTKAWLMQTLLPAVMLVAALALIQHYGPEPETHLLAESILGDSKSNSATPDIHAQGAGRTVFFLDNAKSFRVEQLPHLGKTDASHVLVKYFDYTCEACLDTHEYLDDLLAKYPGQLAVIVLPVPLERACNPHLPLGLKDHRNACKFAELALRVWRADPEIFPSFHQSLFECRDQPYEVAEALAYAMIDPSKLDTVDHSWVIKVLEQNVSDYSLFVRDTPVMPKLLVKETLMVNGKTKDRETLERLLQEQLGIGR